MKVLLIIAAVFFLIGCIPVSVYFAYHERIELRLSILFVKIGIIPKKPLSRKKREKQEAKKAAKAAKKAEAKAKKKKDAAAQTLIAKPTEPPKPKQPLTDKIAALIPWAKLGANFVGEFFRRKLTVTRLRIRAALAGGDPAKTALTVGKAWETIGVAVPILERGFRIKERRIAVYPDFTASKTDVEAELAIRIRVGGVILLGLKYAWRALRLYLKQRKAKKQAAKVGAGSEVQDQGSESAASAS
jgi:hypothetical protein